MIRSTGFAASLSILGISVAILALPLACGSGDVVSGTGTVNAIMADEGKLNISHDPIPALDWPEMTMDFRLAETVELDGVEVGSEVTFQLRKAADGSYEIEALHSTKQ
jgi:Cu/Ag efflux protein CusF